MRKVSKCNVFYHIEKQFQTNSSPLEMTWCVITGPASEAVTVTRPQKRTRTN